MLNVLLFCVNINYILGASPGTGVGRLISQEKALHSTDGRDGNYGDTRRRLSTIVTNWELVLTLDGDGTPEYDVGEANFNEGFQNSYEFIIKRECPSCSADYQTIYYKRYTDPANFDAYGHMKYWSNTNNVLGIDFNLYSTLSDALTDNRQNAWKYCNYNDPGIGAFRDCGKTGSVPWQWTSQSRGGDGGQKASFYVYSQCALCDAGEELVDLGWTRMCFPYCNTGYVPISSQCWRANSNGEIYIPPQGVYGRSGRMPNNC